MNKLHRILAAGLIAAAGGGLAAAPVFAADATTSPTESPTVQTQGQQPAQQTQQQNKTRAHRQHSKANRTARVERVQQALNKNGASLKIDGKWGPNTEAALKSYQKGHGLKVTGRMDKETRSQLFNKS